MRYLIFLVIIVSCAIETKKTNSQNEGVVEKREQVKKEIVSTGPLSERGWDEDVRKGYIENLGKGFYPIEMERAFIDGRIFYDMTEDMVILIHGNPNRRVRESKWTYYDVSKNTLLRIEFKENKVFEFEYPY